jgi:hypothetical protein
VAEQQVRLHLLQRIESHPTTISTLVPPKPRNRMWSAEIIMSGSVAMIAR